MVRQTLWDLTIPYMDDMPQGILLLTVGVDNFNYKSKLIQMIQNNKFGILTSKDPNQNLSQFIYIFSTLR